MASFDRQIKDLADKITREAKRKADAAAPKRASSQARDTKGDADRRRRPTPAQNKQGAARTVRAIGKESVQQTRRATRSVDAKQKKDGGLLGETLHLLYPKGKKGGEGKPRTASVTPNYGAPMAYNADPVTRRFRNLGVAIAQDPDKVAMSTLKSVPQVATGVASLAGSVVNDARKGSVRTLASLPGAMTDDLDRRYGEKDDKEQRRQFKEEGALPEVLDVASVAVPGGGALGRALKPVAQTGALGQVAKRAATTERPSVRVRQGENGTVAQERSANLFRNIGEDVKDKRRVKKQQARMDAAQAGGPAFRGLVPGEGEVVDPKIKRQDRAQRKQLAGQTGRASVKLRNKQDREIRQGVERDVNALNANEKRAFAYVLSLGLKGSDAASVRTLRRKRGEILRSRGDGPKPVGRQADELKDLERILADPEKHLTPRVREVADRARETGYRVAREDPSFADSTARARAVMDQGALMRISREEFDTPDEYVGAVRAAAEKQGLAEGGYFPARPRPQGVFSAFAAGAGDRAVAGAKRTTGALAATGRRDLDPAQLVTALATNLKRGTNWNTVADIWETNSPKWARNAPIEQLRREIDARNLDPQDWVVVDMRQFRDDAARAADDELDAGDLPEDAGGLHNAINTNTYTVEGVPAYFKGTGGRFTLVPRAVAAELQAGTAPAGTLGRTIGKVQGQTSRVLLHTNPTFVPVQVISNSALTAGMAPRAIVRSLKARRWYRDLASGDREIVDAYIGVSPAQDAGRSARYGAAPEGRLARGWAAFIDSPRMLKWERSGFNPLTWNPYFDSKQNAAFRKAVLYDTLHRQRAKQIGRDARAFHEAVPPVLDVLKMPAGPEKAAALRAIEPQIEKAAARVDKILGNYTAYTVKERRFVKRAVLFYGFLRWSMQFTFHTLPVEHPIAVSIATKLGQLQREEVIQLLADEAASKGIGSQEEVEKLLRAGHMPYVFGRVWLTVDGELEYIDTTRINPMLNPLMDALEDPFLAAGGLMSPALQAVADVIYGKSAFKRTDLKNSDGEKLEGTDRLRYIGGSLSRLAFPVRVGEKLLTEGEQGDEALPLISPAPREPKSPDAKARAVQKEQERGSDREVLLDQLIPVRSRRDGTMRGVAKKLDDERKKKRDDESGGSSGGRLRIRSVGAPSAGSGGGIKIKSIGGE